MELLVVAADISGPSDVSQYLVDSHRTGNGRLSAENPFGSVL